jgi:hypothetical protein
MLLVQPWVVVATEEEVVVWNTEESSTRVLIARFLWVLEEVNVSRLEVLEVDIYK